MNPTVFSTIKSHGNMLILILFLVAIYLLSKYKQTERKPKVINKRPMPIIKVKPKSYMANRDVMPHMNYRAGPFDESIWGYPELGGKTITSRNAMI